MVDYPQVLKAHLVIPLCKACGSEFVVNAQEPPAGTSCGVHLEQKHT